MLILIFSAAAATLAVEADGSGDYTSIQAAINAANEGDTVAVGPGTYSEAIEVASKTVTIASTDGASATTLDATGRASSAISVWSGATISGLTVVNEGGRGLLVYGAAALRDVVMEDIGSSDIDGGAAYVNTGSLTMSESTIAGGQGSLGMVYLTDGASFTATDTTFEESETTSGGGIYVFSGDVVLESCTFAELYTTSSGGAIYLGSNSTLTATDSTFFGNLTEYGDGAAVYADHATLSITGGSFELNYSTNYDAGYSGGALQLMQSSASLTGTEIVENYGYYGGAIRSYQSALVLDSVTLDDNWGYYGGAVYADYGVTISDTGSQWAGNTGYYGGGALYVYSDHTIDFTDSTFIENVATYGHGGAIYAYDGAGSFDSVTFEDNYSYYYGGAAFLYYTPSTFTQSTFTGNEALYYGGALAGYYYSDLVIDQSTFTSNETTYYYGGAIYNTYSGLNVKNTAFTANRALDSMAGAIYSYYAAGNNAKVVIAGSTFTSNSAKYHGGAIASDYDYLTLSGNTFHVNDTDSTGMGGAVMVNHAYEVDANSNLFSGNNAGYGGAIYSQQLGSGPEQWTNNVLVENTASIGGAAVWVQSTGAELVNNTLVGNSSVDTAGGIALVETGLTMVNNIIAYSTAGAAVYSYDAFSSNNSLFDYNAFFEITDGIPGGELSGSAVLGETSLSGVAPSFSAYSADGDPDNDSFVLLRDSALIDAGDPKRTDPDGSISDPGAWGGAAVAIADADGDGYESWLDCDDNDATAYPGAADAFYDGINSDCLSGSDFDADGDGEDAVEYDGTDCDDSDPAVQSDCDDEEPVEEGPEEPAADDTPASGRDDSSSAGGCAVVPSGGLMAGMLALLGALGRRRRR